MPETKIILPKSRAEVTLRDATEMRHKDRKKVWASLSEQDNALIQSLDMTEGLIAFLVKDWTLDLILPSIRISSLGELEIADYDALAIEANKAQEILFPNFAKTPENESNPDSPLDESNG